MAQFRYTAIDAAGQTRRGVMEAESEAEVVASLQRQGSVPMHAEPASGGRIADLLHRDIGRRGMRRQDVTNFTRDLSIMLAAGQDLDRSLRFLVETALNARVRTTTDALRKTVRDGGTLATALSEHPGSFPRLYVGLVKAGEAGGSLAPTLQRLAALLEKERALASTIKSALIYPALLLVAAIGSITLLLTQVLPQFVPLFEQNGATLPGPTQMLISAGALVSDYGLYALLFLIAVILLVRQALQGLRVRLDNRQ
jgi:general secretion pathway protein F